VALQPDEPQLARFTGYLLRRAFVRSAGVAKACLPEDSHVREVAVLAILAERGSMSQRALAEITGVNQSLVVKLVDTLEHKGWVIRERNPADRRSYALALTPAGVRALSAFNDDLDRGEAELTEPLSAKEATQLRSWLTILLEGDDAVALTSLSQRTGYLIAVAHRRLRSAAEEQLAPLGLHPRDFGVLSVLQRDAPCTQQHLAQQLGVSPPAALTFVDGLESRGLVSRSRRPDDRRMYDLKLTDAGCAALQQAAEAAALVQEDIARRLGPEADQGLRMLLAKLVADSHLVGATAETVERRDGGVDGSSGVAG
jgi:DNA-binding MarR family transcriptional regulator